MPADETWTHTALAQQIVFGAGALGRLPNLLNVLGMRSVLLVTTAGRAASDDGQRVIRGIGRSLTSTFDRVESHVPVPLVQEALRQARRDGVDGIVSFGGGSCADLGKAVAFFTEQEQGVPATTFADRPVLPHVAIPTTYSGAELTPVFGMTDPSTRQKQGAGGPTSAPVATIHDPDLTIDTPPRVSAETGMNALGHCVEVAWSPHRTPEAEAIALAGILRIHNALPRVYDDPIDRDARTDMLAAAVLAGRGLSNAAMGVHHGLSQMVGARSGIPHGLANALILPHAIRFNAEADPAAVRRIGAALGAPDDPAGAVEALNARLGLDRRWGDVGVAPEDLDAVAELAPGNRNVVNNPRPVSEDDARAILAANE